MSDIIPLFSSHYSLGSSVLTLEEAGKTKVGPVSICDIAQKHGFKQVVLCESKIDGFFEAWRNLQKAGVSQLIYGIKLVICADMTDKTPASERTESNVVIFFRDTQGYYDFLPLHNKAWTEGHFNDYGRLDWKTLKAMWKPSLVLALPFFSSFLARNTITFSSIVPELPVPANEVWCFKEVDSGLPFAPLIERAVDKFAGDTGARVQPVKSVYYADSQSFKAYQVMRARAMGGTFSAPEVEHLCSDRFSMEAYLDLVKK